ncbi:ion channel protein [Phytomonospora endophytica]|uniref:H+/Cl- antiporter ClcA n=1 Tax=Phytomonospora endophytica TaxID=714109 RepID=A0A841FXJ3_9ACTN|nr:ion channel protein [Phytomonospora endophytica]MBB6039453.1 H+/Cl- antiporter ClcA [Phytomonospora endophytica]GIG70180.1 putative ion-transport protein YfeO [Phytomonospora endophytica]
MKRTDVRGLLRLAPLAVLIGAGSALILVAASVLAEKLQHFLWDWLPGRFSVGTDGTWWTFAVLTATGLAVGLVVWKWPGGAGPDPATTSLVSGPQPVSAIPGLLITLVLGLAGGVSLGPENPIIAVNVALAVFLGLRLLPGPGAATWVGIAAAGTIGAMFGTPVAAALTLTESAAGDPETPLWDRMFAPLLAAGAGSLTLQLLEEPSFTITVADYPGLSALDLLTGPAVTLVAAALGLLATLAFPHAHRAFHAMRHPVLILGVGGAVLGLLGMWGGQLTLFKGLEEMKELAADPGAHTIGGLAVIIVVKLIALVIAASSAFRGGRIFPVVFIGVALGLLATAAFPRIPAALAVGCGILGLTMAISRQGWLSIFMAAVVVGDVTLLPLLCLAVLPAWLLLANAPAMEIHPAKAPRPAL